MRRLLTILLLFAFVASEAQYTKALVTLDNGRSCGYGYNIPPPNPNGRLHPVIIFLHGIGERGPAGDIITPAGVDKVFTYSLPKTVSTQPLPYQLPPYKTGSSNLFRIAVFAPQAWNGYGSWPADYTIAMIRIIKNNFANVLDTNRIYLAGISMGGNGTCIALTNAFVRDNIAAAFPIAPGTDFMAGHYQNIANSRVPIYFYANKNDRLAPIAGPDKMVYNLNLLASKHQVQYKRLDVFTGGPDYHQIFPFVLDSLPGDSYQMSNGDMWVNSETIFRTMLRFTKQRYKR